MARIEQMPTVGVEVRFIVGEAEAEALLSLASYGVDNFVQAFYKQLGSAYMAPHEKGLRLLLESARRDLPVILERTKAARLAFMCEPVGKAKEPQKP